MQQVDKIQPDRLPAATCTRKAIRAKGSQLGMCLKSVGGSVWLLTAALVVACGSEAPESGGSVVVAHGVRYVGYFDILENTAKERTSMDAGFRMLDMTTDVNRESVPIVVQQQECKVSHMSAFEPLASRASLSRSQSILPKAGLQDTISAGETIRVSAPDANFAMLRRTSTDDVTVYSTDTEWIDDVSQNPLTISISGDVYPAMESVEIAAVMPFALIAPELPEVVTPSTVFQWEVDAAARSDSSATVFLTASAIDINTATLTIVSCEVEDSGSYVFSDQVRAQLGPMFSSSMYRGIRQVVRVVNAEQSALVITRSSES